MVTASYQVVKTVAVATVMSNEIILVDIIM